MHTQILKVRQEGTRAVRVTREFTLEVPYQVAKDPQLLQEWVARQRIGQYWVPDGSPYMVVEETRALGHSTEAMYRLRDTEPDAAAH